LKDCLRFTMPFGEITKVQEHSDKEFTLWLKDERSFKFS
jgi:hypothetical protein